MNNILIIGAGRSSTALINYVLEQAKTYNWFVTVADADHEEAARKVAGHPNGRATWLDATKVNDRRELIQRADVVVSNDSGPSHVAASVGTDVVAIFGPTRPEITSPRGSGSVVVLHKEIGCNKAPCYHLTCPRNECMRAITVDDVFQAIQKFKR